MTTFPLQCFWRLEIWSRADSSLRSANERCRYKVTPSRIGRVQTWNQPCDMCCFRRYWDCFHNRAAHAACLISVQRAVRKTVFENLSRYGHQGHSVLMVRHLLSPFYTPAQRSWRGCTGFTLSVYPPVDRIVSALYLPKYMLDPFSYLHILSTNFRGCVVCWVLWQII